MAIHHAAKGDLCWHVRSVSRTASADQLLRPHPTQIPGTNYGGNLVGPTSNHPLASLILREMIKFHRVKQELFLP